MRVNKKKKNGYVNIVSTGFFANSLPEHVTANSHLASILSSVTISDCGAQLSATFAKAEQGPWLTLI